MVIIRIIIVCGYVVLYVVLKLRGIWYRILIIMKTTENKKKEVKSAPSADRFAVIQTGGKQYLVKSGDSIKIEKIKNAKIGGVLVFNEVLLFADGDNVKIGKPFVDGASVEARVMEEGRAKKVTIIKYKPKTRYHKKQGHRQTYLKISITNIK